MDKKTLKSLVKVDPETGCWLWQRSTRGSGYAQVSACDHKTRMASHMVYEMCKGPIPEGRVVMHKCDTPLCVCPKHLVLGTQLDNTQDCITKGRFKLPPRTKGAEFTKSARSELVRKYHEVPGFREAQGSRIAAGHAEKRERTPAVPCKLCGTPFKPLRKTNVYCSDVCKTRYGNSKRKPAAPTTKERT